MFRSIGGVVKNLFTSTTAASFDAPYGDIEFFRSSSLMGLEQLKVKQGN